MWGDKALPLIIHMDANLSLRKNGQHDKGAWQIRLENVRTCSVPSSGSPESCVTIQLAI